MSIRVNYHKYDICAKSFEDLSRIILNLIKKGRIEEAIQQIKDCIYYRMYIRHTKYNRHIEFDENDSHDKVILQLEQFKRELIELEKLLSNEVLKPDDVDNISYYSSEGFKFTIKGKKINVFDYEDIRSSYSYRGRYDRSRGRNDRLSPRYIRDDRDDRDGRYGRDFDRDSRHGRYYRGRNDSLSPRKEMDLEDLKQDLNNQYFNIDIRFHQDGEIDKLVEEDYYENNNSSSGGKPKRRRTKKRKSKRRKTRKERK